MALSPFLYLYLPLSTGMVSLCLYMPPSFFHLSVLLRLNFFSFVPEIAPSYKASSQEEHHGEHFCGSCALARDVPHCLVAAGLPLLRCLLAYHPVSLPMCFPSKPNNLVISCLGHFEIRSVHADHAWSDLR